MQYYMDIEGVDWETASLIKTVTGMNIELQEGELVNMWSAWDNGIMPARQDG